MATPPLHLLGEKLLSSSGEVATSDALAGKTAIALYFSAHWCPPCRGFTPKFAEWYTKDLRGKGLEVVFVSSDRDEGAFQEYFGDMPWLAIPYASLADKRGDLDKKYPVAGIPSVIVLGPDGALITKDGQAAICGDPTGEEFPWKPKPVDATICTDKASRSLHPCTMVPKKLYILLDSEGWFEPLRKELEGAGVVYEVWNLVECSVDLCGDPPAGVFLSRVSASCHMRGHRESAEYGRQVVLWLLAHGRRVLNGGCPAGAAIDFELSKMKQMQALTLAGLQVPESAALPVPVLDWSRDRVEYLFPTDPGTSPASEALRNSLGRLADVVERFDGPVVLKPNCGGRGVGVTKFADGKALVQTLRGLQSGSEIPDWVKEAWPVDGVLLVQRLIVPVEPAFITRIEIVGGRFGYAQKTDVSDGATQLCAADGFSTVPRFSVNKDISKESPITKKCLDFADHHGLDISGFEFIVEAGSGKQFIYDINPNTNYSNAVQEEAGLNLYAAVAALCKSELEGTEEGPVRKQARVTSEG